MGELNWYDEKLTAEDRKTEKWADLPDFNGKYRISSLGRIMSDFGQGYKNITPQKNNYGQLVVQLTTHTSNRNDDLKLVMVGKAVAEQFIPNPNGYKFIRFKNDNPLDCRASNIEWTHLTDKMKEQYSAIRKSVNQYELDGTYKATFSSQKEAAERTGAATISEACKQFRPSGGYLWRFTADFPEGENIAPYEPPKKQAILQLDKKTLEVVKRYEDINTLLETFVPETGKGKADRGNIINVCKGKRASAHGYKWAYEENEEE